MGICYTEIKKTCTPFDATHSKKLLSSISIVIEDPAEEPQIEKNENRQRKNLNKYNKK